MQKWTPVQPSTASQLLASMTSYVVSFVWIHHRKRGSSLCPYYRNLLILSCSIHWAFVPLVDTHSRVYWCHAGIYPFSCRTRTYQNMLACLKFYLHFSICRIFVFVIVLLVWDYLIKVIISSFMLFLIFNIRICAEWVALPVLLIWHLTNFYSCYYIIIKWLTKF